MINQCWIEKTRDALRITRPGPDLDALEAVVAAAEKANADARAKHLRTGHPAGEDVTVCIHCERWARPGRPLVHANACPERDNREAQPILNTLLRLEKAERKAVDLLTRG